MMIAWFPFIVVFFVLFMAGGFGGRACRTRGRVRPVAPVALAIAATLLLIVTALLVGAVFVSRPMPAMLPPDPPQKVPEAPRAPPTVSAPHIPVELDQERTPLSGATTTSSPGSPRPAWMDAETGRVDNLYRTRITVGPYLSRTECENELPEALHKAVRAYAARLLGEEKAAHVALSDSYIDEHIVRGEWEERRQTTIDEMIYLHELLEFDGDAKQRIEGSYRQAVVSQRLAYTAAGGGAVLGLLTILFAYLKLDTLTRGYYTGRLRLTALAAILALAAIAGLLVVRVLRGGGWS
ncbi:MAG: hypothetical protein B7Z73_01985 [Planctomycetia bacterium 21-64-5]|nr:MAG: hypothetical protein B7Z73_01985 [Planctomycetia bacterium 21-64-5]